MSKVILSMAFIASLFGLAAFPQYSAPAADSAVMRGSTDWVIVSNNAVSAYSSIENFAVDPSSLQAQITANSSILSGGITTNLSGLVIVDGIVTGTF